MYWELFHLKNIWLQPAQLDCSASELLPSKQPTDIPETTFAQDMRVVPTENLTLSNRRSVFAKMLEFTSDLSQGLFNDGLTLKQNLKM